MPATLTEAASVHYSLKPSPYSSHSILLASLPREGNGRCVLDLGCARGEMAGLLTARGYRVTGVERPDGFDSTFPANVELVIADLDEGLPALNARYDYVVCADILEHLKDPARLLVAIAPLLAPGGVVIASLPNSGNLYFRLNVLAGRFPQDDKGLFDRTHLHFYMWAGWVNLFESCGFHMISVRPTGIPVGLGVPALADTAFGRAAESVCYGLARLWRKLFAYQFVVVCRPNTAKGVL